MIFSTFFFFISLVDDKLVASGSQNNSWPTPHDVAVQLQYPQQGAGATVTYVEVQVDQVY